MRNFSQFSSNTRTIPPDSHLYYDDDDEFDDYDGYYDTINTQEYDISDEYERAKRHYNPEDPDPEDFIYLGPHPEDNM